MFTQRVGVSGRRVNEFSQVRHPLTHRLDDIPVADCTPVVSPNLSDETPVQYPDDYRFDDMARTVSVFPSSPTTVASSKTTAKIITAENSTLSN